jgi:phosphatidylserine/phosphatidylglycerophosphate/cardiolipin synthase-like enzyme
MISKKDNLNNWIIPDGYHDEEVDKAKFSGSNNISSQDGQISVYFRNIEKELIYKINKYPIVVGCVAWLTNERVLKALSNRKRVSIIIQKEDFLRPDTGNWSGEKLRKMYASLPKGVSSKISTNEIWGDLLSLLNYNSYWDSEPVRWLGNFNTDKDPAFPRMHNKFLVFCNEDKSYLKEFPFQEYEEYTKIIPHAVWTGSFNFTDNATRSLENAVYIKNSDIVSSYYAEWQHIFALSESIPNEFWNSGWEWRPDNFRIGT